MDIIKTLAQELEIKPRQAEAAVKLIDDGNTIPFISRYRKEATGSLNDEVLRKLFERLTYLRNLEDKKSQVIATIEAQGKLTPELKAQIAANDAKLTEVEAEYRTLMLSLPNLPDPDLKADGNQPGEPVA